MKEFERCNFFTVMCNCTTPNNGTGYDHNKFLCSDGSMAYCSENEECYATEPFQFDRLNDGCRIPGISLIWKSLGNNAIFIRLSFKYF